MARPRRQRHWLALALLACIGGSIPFVLFFEGLARATATQAAFIQKTLVVWVALLAVPLLHGAARAAARRGDRGCSWPARRGSLGEPGVVTFGVGEAMILAATLLWAVEVVLVKRFLAPLEPRTLAAARMALGAVVLAAWVAVSGRTGDLLGLDASQWGWALLTGALLTAYVATWYAALARAQAVDVTAVLVFGVVVTAALAGVYDGAPIDAVGVVLITLGALLAVATALRLRPRAGVA